MELFSVNCSSSGPLHHPFAGGLVAVLAEVFAEMAAGRSVAVLVLVVTVCPFWFRDLVVEGRTGEGYSVGREQ